MNNQKVTFTSVELVGGVSASSLNKKDTCDLKVSGGLLVHGGVSSAANVYVNNLNIKQKTIVYGALNGTPGLDLSLIGDLTPIDTNLNTRILWDNLHVRSNGTNDNGSRTNDNGSITNDNGNGSSRTNNSSVCKQNFIVNGNLTYYDNHVEKPLFGNCLVVKNNKNQISGLFVNENKSINLYIDDKQAAKFENQTFQCYSENFDLNLHTQYLAPVSALAQGYAFHEPHAIVGNISGYCSHSEGFNNSVKGNISHVQGILNIENGFVNYVQGARNEISGVINHVQCNNSIIMRGGLNNVTADNCILIDSDYCHLEAQSLICNSEVVHSEAECDFEDSSLCHIDSCENKFKATYCNLVHCDSSSTLSGILVSKNAYASSMCLGQSKSHGEYTSSIGHNLIVNNCSMFALNLSSNNCTSNNDNNDNNGNNGNNGNNDNNEIKEKMSMRQTVSGQMSMGQMAMYHLKGKTVNSTNIYLTLNDSEYINFKGFGICSVEISIIGKLIDSKLQGCFGQIILFTVVIDDNNFPKIIGQSHSTPIKSGKLIGCTCSIDFNNKTELQINCKSPDRININWAATVKSTCI